MSSTVFTQQDIYQAALESFDKHGKDRDVIAFNKDLEGNVERLYESVISGNLDDVISFRQLTKVNSNGKVRSIDSPSLRTRILEIAWLDKVKPIYDKANIGVARNCLPGHGITAKIKANSVLHELKHLFYDRRDLRYVLVLDQRHCYQHVNVALYRKAMKDLYRSLGMVPDKALIDFGERVCFNDKRKLPIGTPSSPYIHNIIMLPTDRLMRSCAPFALRYADDCLMAFDNKADLQTAKWRMYNLWWYFYQIRAKRHGVKIVDIDKNGLDFCGYILHRNPNKTVTDHDKGYTTVRRSDMHRAQHATRRNWPCYFGLLRHADTFRQTTNIEQNMKLQQLTQKVRIDREMDAKQIDMRAVEQLPSFTLYNYEIRSNRGTDNWVKALIGVTDNNHPGKELAFEFHGNYQGIIRWLRELEKVYPNREFLPIEEARITNQCGYIFEGSSNQLQYIEP